MNEIAEKDVINIEEIIYEIDGKEVMLDSDLAKLYKCKNGTKEINQAVKNNPEKFGLESYEYKENSGRIKNKSNTQAEVSTPQSNAALPLRRTAIPPASIATTPLTA